MEEVLSIKCIKIKFNKVQKKKMICKEIVNLYLQIEIV